MRTRVEAPKGKREKRRRSRLLRVLQWTAVVVLVGALGGVGLFWYYGRDLPDVAALRDYRPAQTSRILDRNGVVLAEVFEERRTVIPFRDVPEGVLKAVLAAEDAEFYSHEGLDYPGMIRALLVNVREGEFRQGGSTITQQVVKNFLLTPERSVERKIKELLLARRLEQELSKDEILHLWLNQVNFGDGHYGIEEAARYYFGKSVGQLSLGEAALLAGVPKAPTHYSPRHHPEAARRRRDFVLSEMVRKGFIEESAAAVARAEAVRVVQARPETLGCAPEVVALAQKVLRGQVGAAAARHGGYTIHTTIDARLEQKTRAALQAGLRALDERQAYRPGTPTKRGKRRVPALAKKAPRLGHTAVAEVTGIDDRARRLDVKVAGRRGVVDLRAASRWFAADVPVSKVIARGDRVRVTPLEDPPPDGDPARMRLDLGPEGAVVVLDVRSREVLALVGGYDATPGGFDRASAAERQPGSAFKPIVYGAALTTRRFTPATILYDAPEVFAEWRPQNFETWRYQGPVRLREALAQSINVAAIRLLHDVGIQSTIDTARALGISTKMEPTLALALGAYEVRPIELTRAFGVFAAGGERLEAPIVTRIVGPDGRAVALPPPPAPERVMSADEAYLLTSVLTSVVDHGTGKAARRLGRPSAGKTGTSNEARDAWFVGYTPDRVACVWVGFDDHGTLGPGESGARSALPIWIDVMSAAHEGRPAADFPVPPGIVTARIDPATGLLAYEGMTDAITESFLDGTVPTETARPPDVIDPATFLVDATEATTPPPAPAAPPAPPPTGTP